MVDEHAAADPLDALRPVTDARHVRAVIETVRRVHVGPEVRQYCVELVGATRRLPELRLGASPRATLQLVRAARAQAALVRARLRGARRRAGRRGAGAGPPAAAHPRRAGGPPLRRRHRARHWSARHAGARPRPGPARLTASAALLRPHHPRALPARGRRGHGRLRGACSTSATCCGSARSSRCCRCSRCCSPPAPAARCGRRASSRRRGCPWAPPRRSSCTLHVRGSALLGALRLVDTVPDAAGPPPTAPPRFTVHRLPAAAAPRCTTRCGRSLRGVHRDRPAHGRRHRPARAGRVRPRARRRRPAGRAAPGGRAARACPRALGAGEGTAGRGARPPGPGQLRRAGPALPARRRAAPGALAQHRPARRADGAAGGAAVARRHDACCSTGATRAHRGRGAGLQPGVRDQPGGQRLRAPDRPRASPSTLVTEDGVELTGPGPAAGPTPLLDALAALRPSARRDLAGPELHPDTRRRRRARRASRPGHRGAAAGPPPQGRPRRAARHRDLGPGRPAAAGRRRCAAATAATARRGLARRGRRRRSPPAARLGELHRRGRPAHAGAVTTAAPLGSRSDRRPPARGDPPAGPAAVGHRARRRAGRAARRRAGQRRRPGRRRGSATRRSPRPRSWSLGLLLHRFGPVAAVAAASARAVLVLLTALLRRRRRCWASCPARARSAASAR